MLEILKFIFSDFWHWIGTVILVAVLASARLFDVYLGNKIIKKIYDTQSYNSKAALGKAYCPGGKNIENRTWKTNYRGRVLIHASSIPVK